MAGDPDKTPRSITLPRDDWEFLLLGLRQCRRIADTGELPVTAMVGIRLGDRFLHLLQQTQRQLDAAQDASSEECQLGPDWDGFVLQLEAEIYCIREIHPTDHIRSKGGTGQAQSDITLLRSLIMRIRGVQSELGFTGPGKGK